MAEFLSRLLSARTKSGLGVIDVYSDPFAKERLDERCARRGQVTGTMDDQYQPKLFKNFTNNNSSPQKPPTQDPFMKFNTELEQHNMQAQKNEYLPTQHMKRHASNYETSSSPRKISLKNQFTNI